MMDEPPIHYVPQDTMFLWWLGEPPAPALIGALRLRRQPAGR